MALFNPQTQYTTNVDNINNQIASEASESGQYYASLIQAEHAYRANNARLIDDLAPLISDFGKIKKNMELRRIAEIESEIYEEDMKLSDHDLKLKYKENIYDSKAALKNSIQAELTTAGARELNEGGNPILAGYMVNGDVAEKNAQKRLTGMAKDYINWLTVGGADLEFQRADGSTFTRDKANSFQEYVIAARTLRSIWLEQAMDGTTSTQRRKFLHQQMQQDEGIFRTKWLQAQRDAVKSTKENALTTELLDDLSARGGIAIEEHINTNVGWYSGGTADGAYRQARIKTFEKLIKAAQSGQLTREHLVQIGDHYITGRDGNRHQIKKYWKENYNQLLGQVMATERGNAESRKLIRKNEIDSWALNTEQKLLDQEGPVTEDQLDDLLEEYKKQFPGERELPEMIGNWYTKEDEQDDQIEDRLWQTIKNGGIVRKEDLKGITDNNTLAEWLNRAKESSITGMGGDQIKTRDNRIKRQVDAYTKEVHAEGKSVKWEANKEGATAYFNTQYSKYIKAHPDNPGGAFSEAWKDTESAIKAGDFDKYVEVPLEKTTAKNTQKALHAFGKDSNLPNTTVIPGTEDAITQMTEYIESDGRKGDIPAIYRLLSSYTGDSPYAFGAKQVALAAQADGDTPPKVETPKVDQDVEKQLSFSDRMLLLKKGSQGKTNRVIQNAETLDWLLDPSKRFDDYDHILSPTGGDAHLDRPLTEHTVSEVVSLLESGHEAPGAYAFTPTELLEALQATGISGDRLFDEVTQDLLTLNLYRAHANRNYRGGFYNELVELSPVQLEQADEVIENIPPFNRTENILKALHGYGGNVPVTQ